MENKDQLDRIEAKLDRILELLEPRQQPTQPTQALYYTDGGTRNNGRRGFQESVICVANSAGEVVVLEEIGDKTNNEAELTAILRCLQLAPESLITIITDSQLCVGWMKKGRSPKAHLNEIIRQIKSLDKPFEIIWKPRAENKAGWIIESQYGL